MRATSTNTHLNTYTHRRRVRRACVADCLLVDTLDGACDELLTRRQRQQRLALQLARHHVHVTLQLLHVTLQVM